MTTRSPEGVAHERDNARETPDAPQSQHHGDEMSALIIVAFFLVAALIIELTKAPRS